MANRFVDESAPPAEPRSRMRALIRQNSEKIATIAEDVVLPRHRRSMHRMNSIATPTPAATATQVFFPLSEVETDTCVVPMTEVKSVECDEMEPKYFPTFMISLSVIQILFVCFMNKYNNYPMLVLGYDPHRRYQIWRFLTIMLVHTRPLHLCSNILLQLILGVLLEIIHKWTRILVIYFASVVGGSLFISVLSPNSYAMGASAGVYGLLFSHLSTIILNWNEMDKKPLRLSMLLFYMIADFGINFVVDDLDTNYANRLGGGLTGFLVSILVLKNFDRQPRNQIMKFVCIGLLATLALIMVLVNVFAWDLYLPTESNENYQNSYDNFVYQRAIASAENSAAREFCKQITKCRLLLNKFNVSSLGTTETSD